MPSVRLKIAVVGTGGVFICSTGPILDLAVAGAFAAYALLARGAPANGPLA
jgi:hypothetical protein